MTSSLTKIDCDFFRGASVAPGRASFVAINPTAKPGSLVMAGTSVIDDGIKGQVGCRLALEHFVEGVLDYYAQGKRRREAADDSVAILEAGFKRANRSVFDFSQKMLASGKLTSSLIGVVIEDDFVSVGRVGFGGVYVYRGGEVAPFLDSAGERPMMLGADATVQVQLATLGLEGCDEVIVVSRELSGIEAQSVAGCIKGAEEDERLDLSTIVGLFNDSRNLDFACRASIGPRAIYLERSGVRRVRA